MAIVLCIETSGGNCSVAVAADDTLLSLREESSEHFAHAEKLHLFIRDVMKEAGRELAELTAIGVSRGPGSYTGLRIGVSAAKGLCLALDIPLVSYPVPEVLAFQMRASFPDAMLYVPMIDARRMEVYTASYDPRMVVMEPIRAVVLDDSFFLRTETPAVYGGDGAEKAAGWKASGRIFFPCEPSAATGCVLAMEAIRAGRVEDLAYFEPFYLKDFITGRPAGTIPGGAS